MSTDNVGNTTDEQTYLLNELLTLLDNQLELTHKGVSTGEEFNTLAAKIASIANKLAQSKVLEFAQFKNQHEQLRKSYKDLCLTLAAEQAETADAINRVRKGKKTIEAYRNNL